MKKFIKPIFVIIFFSFFFPSLLAQDSRFRHYTAENGLPSSTVYKIIQDTKGFMWFATEAGVAKFDGYEFKIFTTQDGLTDNIILSIYEDRDQRIWLVDYSRKLCFIKNDSVHPLKAAEVHDFEAYEILQDMDYNLLINTLKSGLVRCNRDGNFLERFAPDLIPPTVYSLLQDNNGTIWYGVYSEFGTIKQIINDKYRVAGYRLHDSLSGTFAIVPIKGNRVFGKTDTHILELLDSTYYVVFSLTQMNKQSRLGNTNTDHSGNLLIATDNGAYMLDVDSFHLHTLIDSGAINAVQEDSERNLWFSTPNNGVYFLSSNARRIKNYDKSNGLPDAITAISADKQGNVYFGSITGNIYIYRDGKIVPANFSDKLNSSVEHICLIDSNKIWIGTNEGLVMCDTQSSDNVLTWPQKILNVSKKENNVEAFKMSKKYNHLRMAPVRAILPLHNGKFLAGNFHGLFQIEDSANHYLIKKLNFAIKVNSLCLDQDGVVWIGSTKGAWRKKGDEYIPSQDERLSNSNITDIKADDQNLLWIATSDNGIYAWRDSVVLHLNAKNGLTSNSIYDLNIHKNVAWAASNKGLNRITITSRIPELTYNIMQVNKQDGIITDEVLSICQYGDYVYAGTNEGLTVFRNSEVHVDTITPPVYFSSFSIWNKDTLLSSNYSLKHDRNNVTIKYVGLSYGSGKDISYKYKMEGIDHNWITTTNRGVSYPILPPGNYKFLVKAVNADGIESRHPASINLTINPPFWQTWWFKASYWIAGILIVAGIIFFVIRYYRNREAFRNRMRELEGMALRAQMNPHFVFNALNAIHDFIGESDQKSAHIYLSKFAKLIRLILDNSSKTNNILRDEIKALELYIGLENLRFSNKFDYRINIDPRINIDEIEIPPMLIQPYVENAIRHGLMKKAGKGKLEINIKLKEDKLHCEVIDDGIGREKAEELNSHHLRKHQSHGMHITKERLNNLESSTDKSDLQITDLKDEKGNTNGTKVEFSVAIN